MEKDNRIIAFLEKPMNQAILVLLMIVVFTLLDYSLPHVNTLLEVNSGSWIVATAMIFFFVILNSLIALRIVNIIPYWSRSVILYIGLLVISYGWCYFLSGKHIDEVGSFRWLWFVLTITYMVFFSIARSVKRVVDIADKQDEKLRGE
jgi:hypothetical protein